MTCTFYAIHLYVCATYYLVHIGIVLFFVCACTYITVLNTEKSLL